MHALHAALALWLLEALRAFPQDKAHTATCDGDPSNYYDKTAGRCCYRCPSVEAGEQSLWGAADSFLFSTCLLSRPPPVPSLQEGVPLQMSEACPGLSPMHPCPQTSADCTKQCERDYYLSESGRCTPCVSCSRGFAAPAGTAKKDTICEPLAPESRPDCSSPAGCKAPNSPISGFFPSSKDSQVTPMSPEWPGDNSNTRTTLLRGGASLTPEEASRLMRASTSPSSLGKLSPDPGLSPMQPCPQGSPSCRKQCEPDYYLDRNGRCRACVSCSRDDLVEKTPCSWNSSRVCECRPGMHCATSATNSCARCVSLPKCTPAMAVRRQEMATRDTTYKSPPPGSHPDCSIPQGSSEKPASTTPTPTPLLVSQTRKMLSVPTSAPISLSSTAKPIVDSGPALFSVLLVLLVLVVGLFFLLCYWRPCRKQIRQKLHLCYPGQTFRPRPTPADSSPRRNLTQPRRIEAEEELGLMSLPAVETCLNVGAACPNSLPLQDASPAEGPSSPKDLPEPRVSTEHTNNRIEKIYIMKADTVIVGTVKTEVPEGRGLVGPAEPEFDEELEVDHVPHYPEQETEPPVSSCGDVMFSVEEEGKEDPGK
ncbi:Tumor necrosis factor receptor superfamily member 8 [Tupaia chinensis]|uniref:Tumor necrosis factor receptor superfamily member 8 n=1 Tax=Tupaia chinensis TaxID=246437 RepID=L9L5E8_TUPCH|nr:Tumor necrosis factor receptor superfamily member 8 [Tupaia chinensis]